MWCVAGIHQALNNDQYCTRLYDIADCESRCTKLHPLDGPCQPEYGIIHCVLYIGNNASHQGFISKREKGCAVTVYPYMQSEIFQSALNSRVGRIRGLKKHRQFCIGLRK
jgi:hypothetical protein